MGVITEISPAAEKPLSRKVDGGRFGPLIVELEAGVLNLRMPGHRFRMGPVSYEHLYVVAAELVASQRRRLRKPKHKRSARLARKGA